MDGIRESSGYSRSGGQRDGRWESHTRFQSEQPPDLIGLVDMPGGGLLSRKAPVISLNLTLRGPEEVFKKLIERWDLLDHAALILAGNAAPEAKRHVNRVLIGRNRLGSDDERERVAELFKIFQLVHSLFREQAVERAFLNEPQDRLGGTSLIDLIKSGSWPKMIRARQFIELHAGL
jgi:uncharacterized protein (DUF2384 family)